MSVRSACGSFRPFVVTVFAAVIAAGIPSIAAELKPGVIFTPGIDLAKTVNSVSPGNFRLDFTAAVLDPDRRAFSGYIAVVDGTVVPGFGRAPDFNRAVHTVSATNLMFDGTRLTGSMVVTFKSDGWRPADKSDTVVDCRVDAALVADGADTNGDARAEDMWSAVAARAGKGFVVKGRAACKMAGKDGTYESPLSGTLSLAPGGNRWDAGTWDAGMKFSFDLGTRRVNWNNRRVAQIGFAPAVDWSPYDGLRIEVSTDRPRDDAEVTVWIRESDGSWYYYRSAVPLSAGENTAILRFSDFEEAEYVSPEDHADEDYVMDLRSISHLGVGVVNPLGVGGVEFTVKALDLFKEPDADSGPVEARVSGRMLSVNGHDVVPAGLFGGYAPFLPAKYRPGCQRNIRALPDGSPTVLRSQYAELRWVTMPRELLKRLSSGPPGTLDAHIWSLLQDPRVKTHVDGILAAPSEGKGAERVGAMTAAIFNRILNANGFYNEAVWKGVDVTGVLAGLLPELLSDETPKSRRLVIHRMLLAAAYPEHIEPLPGPEPPEMFIVDCMGERGEASMYVRGKDWEAQMRDAGAAYARTVKAESCPAVVEWWNEPYLNWASNRRNMQPEFFRQDLAVEGGPVAVAWGSERDVVPHLKWKLVTYQDRKTKQKKSEWQVEDETMFTYWSGRANGYMYDKTFEAFAKGVKETHPDVQMVAGWGFRWQEDHWAGWDILYKPTLDRGIQWIDGVSEHHYQGDTTAMQGAYEVMLAYTMSRHGKWIHCYNTECGDLVDVPARGVVSSKELAAAAKEYRSACYNLRDILYSVLKTPDKIRSRTVIHNDGIPLATDACYGMLRDLRGRLVACDTSDPKVWCVASVDGTDPKALPSEPGQTLVAVVWNDHRTVRSVKVVLNAPAGTTIHEGATETLSVDASTLKVGREKGVVRAEGGNRLETVATIPGRSAWKVAFPLTGTIGAGPDVVRRQFFADDVVKIVGRDTPWSTVVNIDAALLKTCRRAWLRTVVESLADGEGEVKVGSEMSLALPRAPTRDNGNKIVDMPIDPAKLTPSTRLVFSLADPGQAGYRVDMASVVLEHETD